MCVAAAFGGQYGAYTRGDGRVQFMEALGFTNSPKIEDLKPANFYAEVSKERVSLLDADLTVVFGLGAGDELKNDTVLNSIPSAKDGRLLIIDDADLVNALLHELGAEHPVHVWRSSSRMVKDSPGVTDRGRCAPATPREARVRARTGGLTTRGLGLVARGRWSARGGAVLSIAVGTKSIPLRHGAGTRSTARSATRPGPRT